MRLTPMKMDIDQDGGVETIALSRPASPVAVVVVTMAALLSIQVAIVLATRSVGLTLMVLLVIAAASALWLAVIALEELLPTTLVLDKGGLKVSRLLGTRAYEWHDVAAVRLVTSNGTLSDDARLDSGARLAVGLFLKTTVKKTAAEGEADVLLFSASSQHANDLLKLVEHVVGYKSAVAAGTTDRNRRIRRAAPVVAPTTFRKPPAPVSGA